MNNCGKQGKKCNIDDIYGAMTVDCVNNECVANSCYEGVLQDGYCAEEGCSKENPKRCDMYQIAYCCPKEVQLCDRQDIEKCEQSIVLD